MAPNKFEKHFKKELEEREIQPSTKAWGKLSEKIGATPPQASKRGYVWYAIAASFVGLIILSVVLFNAKAPILETKTIVVEDDKEVIEEMIDFQNVEIEKTNTEVVAIEKIPKDKANVNIVKASINVVKKEALVEQLAKVTDDLQPLLSDDSEGIINAKVLEVLAQIDILEKNNEAITDAEVDSLLLKAQEDILKEKLFNLNNSVNAMALLTEVEDELDQSFRDQIFESLKTKFLEVRTAVADRNN